MKKILCLLIILSFALCACKESAPGDESVSLEPIEIRTDTEQNAETETAPATETETETGTESETETETQTKTETETEKARVKVEGLTLDKYEVNISVGASDMPWVTMTPEGADDKSEKWTSDNTAVATVDAWGNIYGVAEGDCTVTVSSVDNPEVKAEVKVHVKAKPAPAPVEGLTYIQGILIANKTYALPADYNPGIDPEAQAAFYEMQAAAASEGVNLYIDNGFRSYELQSWLYNYYVSVDGKAAADTYSARPGHSEHQTGLAFDLSPVSDSFAYTPEGIWTNENCWKYGFIIRYPKDKEAITGYKYEPWHIRYLGKEVAKAVYESGLCLEEYLGIDSVYSY